MFGKYLSIFERALKDAQKTEQTILCLVKKAKQVLAGRREVIEAVERKRARWTCRQTGRRAEGFIGTVAAQPGSPTHLHY